MELSPQEDQVVACADRLEVWPQTSVPVAQVGHLIALKLLSRDDRRLQDQLGLQALDSKRAKLPASASPNTTRSWNAGTTLVSPAR